MHQVTLQTYSYRSLADRCQRLQDYTALAATVQAAFSQPQVPSQAMKALNESFKLNLYKFSDRTNHNVDLDFVMRFFDELAGGSTVANTLVLGTVEKLLQQIEAGSTPRGSMLRVYFILLLDLQLLLPQHVGILKILAHHLEVLPADSLKVLARWLCDIDRQRFGLMVSMVQKTLSQHILKLLPTESLDELDPVMMTDRISACCRYLELLYHSNQLKIRLPLDSFKNSEVMKHFDPTEQFKLNYKGIRILNFMLFPFLLSIDYKNRLLEIETRVEHHINMQRGLTNMINGVIDQELKPNQTVVNSLYFMLQVNRETILDDSIEKLSRTKSSLKNPLKVAFLGEMGDDGGGVKKEYFQLLIKEIFNPNRDLFVTKGNGRLHWFNAQTFEAPIMFEFLGMILGLSIYNTTLLELKFPKVLYKKLLQRQGQTLDALEELKEIEPDYYKSFKYLLETQESLDTLEMTFEAEMENYGIKTVHLLKPYGNMIAVTQSNKNEYVHLYADWLLNKSVQREFTAFKRGFDKVVTSNVIHVLPNVIQLFSAEELERIICGCQTLDFKELEKVVKYEGGFSERSSTIRALWDILHGYDLTMKKAFLFFVTGSDRAPIRGLSSLKMTIQREADGENLPCSRTCSSVLLLPDYATRQKLRQKLTLTLQFKESFGLI